MGILNPNELAGISGGPDIYIYYIYIYISGSPETPAAARKFACHDQEGRLFVGMIKLSKVRYF